MVMLLVTIVIVGATTYIWCTRGFFSALIHLVCVFAAGAVAFGVWEPVSYAFLKFAPERGFFAPLGEMSWGLGLAVPFALALAILRGIVDTLLPANAQCEPAMDYAGGAVCGAGAGVISAGIAVISIGMIRVPPDFMGYQPVSYTSGAARGSVERAATGFSMSLWTDTIVAGMYSHLSLTTMRTMNPMARWHPSLETYPGALRMAYDGRARVTVRPDGFRLTAWYIVGDMQKPTKFNDLLTDEWRSVPQKASTLDGRTFGQDEDLLAGYIAGYTMIFNTKAREKTGQVVIGPGQVRLVVENEENEESMALHPVAVVTNVEDATRKAFARFRYDADNIYTSSVGGASEATMAFEFPVPAGYRPLALYVKGVRVDLEERFTQPTAVFADPSDRDSAINAGEMAEMTDVGPILDESGRPVQAPQGQDFRPDPIVVTASMGITLQRGGEGSLKTVQEGRGWAVLEGEHEIAVNRVGAGHGLDHKLKIDRFSTTDDTSIVKVVLTPHHRDLDFNQKVEAADRGAEPVLVDSNGTRYPAAGWVYKDSAKWWIRYDRGSPVRTLNDLPAVSRSSSDRELTLVFVVSANVDIVEFRVGDTVLDDLSRRPIKATPTGGRR